MKRIGAVIVGLVCLGVVAVHAEDVNKDLSMESFNASINEAKQSQVKLAGYVVGDDLSAGKPSKPVEFVTLQGGKFTMGTDNGDRTAKPIHEVTIATFDMSDTLVTVEQYAECVTKRACRRPDTGDYDCYQSGVAGRTRCKRATGNTCNWEVAGRQRHPINCVSWQDASDFAKFKGARLPSESEWEYAATSGGQNQKYPWGNDAPTCDKAVMDDCGNNGTMPVCSKSAGNTKQGLCDMAGNVWQWVQDTYEDSYDKAPRDGSAFEAENVGRVLRGGAYNWEAEHLRADSRLRRDLSDRYGSIGFRLARSRR